MPNTERGAAFWCRPQNGCEFASDDVISISDLKNLFAPHAAVRNATPRIRSKFHLSFTNICVRHFEEETKIRLFVFKTNNFEGPGTFVGQKAKMLFFSLRHASRTRGIPPPPTKKKNTPQVRLISIWTKPKAVWTTPPPSTTTTQAYAQKTKFKSRSTAKKVRNPDKESECQFPANCTIEVMINRSFELHIFTQISRKFSLFHSCQRVKSVSTMLKTLNTPKTYLFR